MRPCSWLVVAIAMVMLGAACSSNASDPLAYDPQGAETCEELADMFIGSHVRMLDALGSRTDADLEGEVPPEIRTASAEIGEWFIGEAGARITSLCPGGAAEFESYFCEDVASIEPQGEAGERHVRDNVPRCN